MWQVTVVCPGARRCNVKVTPNTVLLQVLEQACSRQKLDPSLYTLKYHGKQVDLSLSVRFSGISNNGKVELVETERPRSDDGEVLVAVQNENGTRVQSSFHSTTTLWDVLTHHKLDAPPDGTELCLSYMRQEISGEAALKSTQLRSIGLATGRGVIRLSHRRRSGESKTEDNSDVVNVDSSRDKNDGDMKVDPSGGGERGGEGGGGGGGGETEVKDEVVMMAVEDDEPRKKHHQQNSAVSMDTADKEEELPYFPVHPISYFRGGNMSSQSPLEEEETTSSSLSPPHLPAATMETNHQPTISILSQFASILKPHPLAPPLSQTKVYDEPCDREMMVYSLDDPLPLPPQEEVSDQFFQHTVTDLHVMHSDLKKQATSSDAPLMTSAMRAVREEIKLHKYHKSIVRVYFTDRWVLQGCFRPRENLKMLVSFIREHLTDPKVKFHLYTTPPKTVLKSAKVTFAEAGFVPAAVVYVGVEDNKPHPHLSDSALKRAVSSLQAEVNQRQLRSHSLSDGATTSLGPESGSSSSSSSSRQLQPRSTLPHQSYSSVLLPSQDHHSVTTPHSSSKPPDETGGGGGGSKDTTKVPKWFRPGGLK